jgi:hypothetical protein
MIRLLLFLALAAGLAYCGATVKLGKRTFFGHVRAIWATEEVQELKDGVKENIGPAAKKVKNEIHELTSDDDKERKGSGSAVPPPAPVPSPLPATP